MAGEAPA